jgi:phosphatidylinositol dimannoside acyltransferase
LSRSATAVIPPAPRRLIQAFVKYREALGMEMLPLTGGVSSFGILARRLRAGRLVCIVVDRDLNGTGIEVGFFGGKAKFPATAAVLAVHTGAALMPAATWFEGDSDWGARIYDEIPVPESGDRKERSR